MIYWTEGAIPCLPALQHRQRGKQRPRDLIAAAVCAFDVETSPVADGTENAVVYLWSFACAQSMSDIRTYYGRTVDEFLSFLVYFLDAQDPLYKLVIYVHNLSYEFQFLRGILPITNVFCLDERKILKFTAFGGRVEFRDSLRLQGTSLDQFARDMGAPHRKLSGDDFDYSKIRYWFTPLTPFELQYSENDVVCLVESVIIKMANSGDDLYSIPMTATGYLRRDVKRAINNCGTLRAELRRTFPDADLYRALRYAFRGGDTHAARRYAGKIIADVSSYDRSSSYPDVMINCQYPRGVFRRIAHPTLRRVRDLMDTGAALLLHVVMRRVQLRDWRWQWPYLAIHKCVCDRKTTAVDNGRILRSDLVETYITDIDFRIICTEYTGEIQIIECWWARYGKLPAAFTNIIRKLYQDKTALKGNAAEKLHYDLSKSKINSCYGLTAQDPCKDSVVYNLIEDKYELGTDTLDDLIKKYHERGILPYQWGVWTTAHARAALHAGLYAVDGIPGKNLYTTKSRAVYVDTDSIKCLGAADLAEFNRRAVAASTENGATATDSKGNIHYMGVFEEEKDNFCNKFVTLGAKKYCGVHADGRLDITVAGVNKKLGAIELQSIENFKIGYIFRDAGGVEAVYNDHVSYTTRVDGYNVDVRSNVLLRPSTYTLGVTSEYYALIFGQNADIQL